MGLNLTAPTPDRPVSHAAALSGPRDAAVASVARPWGGFPGQWITGVCAVLAPLLAIAASALGMASYRAGGADFVAGMAAHPLSFGLGVQMSEASMVILLVAVVGIAGAVASARPRLGRAAGLVAVIGLCGPISFESIYWAASHLTDTAAHRAAAAVLLDQSQIIPRTVMNVSGPAIVLGFILLAVATARSGLLSRGRSVLLGMGAIMPFGFISGHLIISLVAFAGLAAALVPMGWRLLLGRP